MRIRIAHDPETNKTSVTDDNTGEPIKGVYSLGFYREVGGLPIVVLQLHAADIEVDVLADVTSIDDTVRRYAVRDTDLPALVDA